MKLNETKICAQLWNGIAIKPSGTAGICCEITEELTDMNVRDNTFKEILFHPKLQDMRSQMLNGEEPKECWRCFSKEKLGAHSLRNELNNFYNDVNGEWDEEFIEPQNVEFVLGNLCQLRCIMCHPSRSAKVADAHEYINTHGMRDSFRVNIPLVPMKMDVGWVEDPALWDDLAEQSITARRIYLNGGEPLLAKQHEKVLDKLIESGLAKKTLLVYSSNGLLFDDEHLKRWKQFKHVSISFSLDDLAERNHFIRYPSNWGQVTAALEKVKRWTLDKGNFNVNISMWCAINMFSFAYLPEYLRFFRTYYPMISIGWRAIQTPSYFNPANLPKAFKEQIAERIYAELKHHNPQRVLNLASEIKMIVDEQEDPKMLEDGIAFMKLNAEHQEVDLNQLFPRLSFLI